MTYLRESELEQCLFAFRLLADYSDRLIDENATGEAAVEEEAVREEVGKEMMTLDLGAF